VDEMKRRLHDLVDGETSRVSFNDVWRKADMPKGNRKARRRSGFWWAASGIVAAVVVAAIVLGRPPLPTGNPNGTTPPASRHEGTTVGSSGVVVPSPVFASVDMTSSQSGWALVQEPSSTSAPVKVARTTNQGSTWADVTPAGAEGSFAFDPVSPDTAYLAAIQATRSVTVYVTTDGGKAWTHGPAVPITYGDGNGYLDAVGPDVFMEIGAPGMANALPAQLFASTDGGLTFRLVTQSATSSSSRNSFPGFGPVVFLTAQDGFTAPVHGGTTGLGLYQTTDGGKTWQAARLPPGAQQVQLPVFTGQSGLAEAYGATSSANGANVFVGTSDGGATWKTYGIPLGPDTMVASDVVNGRTAIVATMSGNILTTADGGMTWATTSPGPAAKALLAGNIITGVSFASPEVGWALMGPKGSAVQNQTLYLTTDGGTSWTQVAQ